MMLYKVTITPSSDFATTLRGDTLFGQMCWAIAYSFGQERLKGLLRDYREGEEPFLVVSDAFPKDFLPKPKMPSRFLKEKSEDKKLNRKKVWLTLDTLLGGAYEEAKQAKDIEVDDSFDVNIHNAINYKTSHTGDGFDPYALEVFTLGKKDIYCLIDENSLGGKELQELLELIAQMGYGKKSTIGKGRFVIDSMEQVELRNRASVFMSLSPFSPRSVGTETIYYEPFTRFGKFGGDRAYKNAFKKPILLADVASVVVFDEVQEHQYLGRPISGLSDIPEYSDTVHQGYSIVLPLKDLSDD